MKYGHARIIGEPDSWGRTIKVLSLFDGMSVAQQALKELMYLPEYYASEIDPYAIAVTQSNFNDTTQLGNVAELSLNTWNILTGGVDLLIGGSPCQDLSIARKDRKGLDGTKSSLFYEYVKILHQVKPKYFVLENVASMSEKDKALITSSLGVEPVMLDASLVSAQSRKRLFWVGKLDPTIREYLTVAIAQPEDRHIFFKDILQESVDESYYLDEAGLKTLFRKSYGAKGKVFTKEDLKTSPATTNSGGGNGLYFLQTPRGTNMGGKRGLNGKTPALTTSKWVQNNRLVDGERIRKLTPVECLRLQSLPDNYFDRALYNKKPISNSQKYKMIGNAFNCEIIKHIIKHLDL